MRFLPELSGREARRGPAATRRPRRVAPRVESLDGRVLLSTMVANSDGFSEVVNGGVVLHFQDKNWYNESPHNGNFATVVVSHNPAGKEEYFAQDGYGNVYASLAGSGQWTSTGGTLKLGSMVANWNGISGISALNASPLSTLSHPHRGF